MGLLYLMFPHLEIKFVVILLMSEHWNFLPANRSTTSMSLLEK